jgi:hypothetical protein
MAIHSMSSVPFEALLQEHQNIEVLESGTLTSLSGL